MKTVHKDGSMITYYIDENKKCVTAVIDTVELFNDYKKSIKFGDVYYDWPYKKYKKYDSSRYLKATVVPRDGDIFDEDLGMKIACKKVLIKYYNIKRRVLMDVSKEVSEYMKHLYKETEFASNRYAKFLQEYQEA